MKQRLKNLLIKIISIKFLVYLISVGLYIYHPDIDSLIYVTTTTGLLLGLRTFEKLKGVNNCGKE